MLINEADLRSPTIIVDEISRESNSFTVSLNPLACGPQALPLGNLGREGHWETASPFGSGPVVR